MIRNFNVQILSSRYFDPWRLLQIFSRIKRIFFKLNARRNLYRGYSKIKDLAFFENKSFQRSIDGCMSVTINVTKIVLYKIFEI